MSKTSLVRGAVVKWLAIGLGVLGLAGVMGSLFGGFLLDDLQMQPFYGWRTEAAPTKEHRYSVPLDEYSCDSVVYQIVSGGAGSAGLEVTLFKSGNKVLEIGGKESTFVGFKDVDGDGRKEVLTTSLSPLAEAVVWKAVNGRFQRTDPNQRSRLLLRVAHGLFYAPFGVGVGILLVIVSIVLLFRRKATGVA